MSGTLMRRLLIIAAAIGLATFFLVTNGINYGLDLKGGMYLAMEVADPQGTMTAEARRDATDQALDVIRNRVDQFGVSERNIQKYGDNRIIVELPGIQDEERAKEIIRQTALLEFQHVLPTAPVEAVLHRIDAAILRARPELAVAPDTTAAPAQPSALDLLFQQQRDSAAARSDTAEGDSAAAPVSTRPEDRPLSVLLNQGPPGEFLVAVENVDRVNQFLAIPEVQRLLPRGTTLRWARKPEAQGAQLFRSLYVLQDKPFMLGTAIDNAMPGKDPQYNRTIVSFELNRRGGRTFGRETAAHIGDRIAIVLDRQVVSAPNVISQITTSGQIEMGNAPMTEARDLALVLRSGALPAEINFLEQRSVGPTLGNDSIEQGKMAGIIGIVLILVIMIGYYRMAGVFACIALFVYVLIVLGGLSAFNATFTAPGIAGFLLSIGMGVDGNVLIFERIREELAAGKNNRAAVDAGFDNAMSAIIDTHLTTLITSLILYNFGTGPVQGFAVTLSVGIIASFFSAVFVTRTLFLLYINRRSPTEPISI